VRGPCLIEFGQYRFQDAFDVLPDFIVPESHYPIIVLPQPVVAQGVFWVCRVLAPVNLKHKSLFAAKKVDNIRTHRFLANEFVAAKPARPEMRPHQLLGLGRVVT